MEPLNDRELDELLTRWEAPDAPRTLERKIRLARRESLWKWLLTGSIRVPVPLTLAVAAVLVALFVMVTERGPRRNVHPQTTVGEFQPVKRLQPRILRSNYEGDY